MRSALTSTPRSVPSNAHRSPAKAQPELLRLPFYVDGFPHDFSNIYMLAAIDLFLQPVYTAPSIEHLEEVKRPLFCTLPSVDDPM